MLTPKILTKGLVLLALFYFTGLILAGCSSGESESQVLLIQGPTMGTTYSIKIRVSNQQLEILEQDALADQIQRALASFNAVASTYLKNSELSQLNRAEPKQWIELSPMLADILRLAQEVSINTRGAFDITVGPLVNLWGFGPEDVSIEPTDRQIAEIKSRIGYTYIELEGDSIRLDHPMYIDLSAIAKGYATDVIGELLDEQGIHDYMVEIGGELKIKGFNARGENWVIGVEKPALGREGAMQAVSGDGIAIATSGDYRNFREEGGERVSHTINPVTGRPIKHNLASVTVIALDGGSADAYATALNVLGPEQGFELAEQQNLAAFFIIRDGESFRVKYTQAFENYMVQ